MSERLIKTRLQKEYDSLPDCRYDPLNNWKCHRPSEETSEEAKKACRDCLISNITDALEEDQPSEVMRSVISLVKFYELRD